MSAMRPFWYQAGEDDRPPEADLFHVLDLVPVGVMDALNQLRELQLAANALDGHEAVQADGHLYGDLERVIVNLTDRWFGPYAPEIRFHVIDSGESFSYVATALAREERAIIAGLLAYKAARL